MPKESKHSRGRRKEQTDKKRKREEPTDEENATSKRQKIPISLENPEVNFTGLDNSLAEDGPPLSTERPFYGMLEDEEQEYFRRADELLELNDFPTAEERDLFLDNVFREAEGKELKIACSQSCSRLMERLILLSSTRQKKKLFGVFAGNFSHLCQHRFASHCVESLLVGSAGVVTRELTGDENIEGTQNKEEDFETGDLEKDTENDSMESLFLATLDELEGQMTFLLTDRFASHTLRVLLVILSGRPLEKSSTNSLLKSKKKEKIGVANMDSTPTDFSLSKRAVPESFQFAVEKIISDTVATMDTSFIRVLATHPTGNPTLQLLLELELTNPTSKKGANSDQKTIISALLPDEIGEEGSSSSVFMNGLMYDPIGSRLLETICAHAPGKLFKQIYKATFKQRIAGLARNEIASYVVIRVLNRLSKEDLEDAADQMVPQIQGLIERNRTVIIKTLMERCYARHAKSSVKTLSEAIASSYGSDPSTLLLKMASIDDTDALIKAMEVAAQPEVHDEMEEAGETTNVMPKKKITTPQNMRPTPQQTHGSLLAQSLLSIPGPPSTLIQDSLLALPQPILQALALYIPTSHILQAAFSPKSPPIFRRKLITALLFSPTQPDGPLTLALSSTGSRLLDTLLPSTASTNSLFTLTERIALSLTHHEAILRDSFTGRIIWRNWQLDTFKRRRGEWVNSIKQLAAAKFPSATNDATEEATEEVAEESAVTKSKKKNKNKTPGRSKVDAGPKKSAIQLARERHAAAKAGVGGVNAVKIGSKGTGVNSGKLGAKKSGAVDIGSVHPSRKVAVGL